jgi:hypothetical protein
MAWQSVIPADPTVAGWWREAAEREEAERRAAVAARADELRAEKIERLKALAHRVDMRAAGAVQSANWERIQRRADMRGAVRHPGGTLVSQSAGREVFHHPGGRILDVR